MSENVPYRIKARWLVFYMVISAIASLILVNVPWFLWFRESPSAPLPQALTRLVLYLLLLAFLMRPLRRSGESLRSLFGIRPKRDAIRWAMATALALMGISFASVYILFLPLFYFMPEYFEWLIELDMSLIWAEGKLYPLANVVHLLAGVVVGPFVEELLFRGLLLPSWVSRWGRMRAVIFSSCLFAIGHIDLLGSFVFGVVASVAFLRLGSLWLPFVIHATHNALVWILEAAEVLLADKSTYTLADLQGSWWIGAVGLSFGLPLLLFMMRRVPRASTEDLAAQQGAAIGPPTSSG